MKYIGIIPARFESTRFPGKPLCDIGGKAMIQRVYEQVSKVTSFSEIMVATDDDRIYNAVKDFGGNVMMTSSAHRSGTERCAEVFRNISTQYQQTETVIVNIQGDEPFIRPQQIEELLPVFQQPETKIATLIHPIEDKQMLGNPNTVKVVISNLNQALYFSRMPLPYVLNPNEKSHTFYKHIGLYAYRADTLLSIVQLSPSPLEIAENLEQLRWLENGYSVSVHITQFESTLAIDTPDDVMKANFYLKNINI